MKKPLIAAITGLAALLAVTFSPSSVDASHSWGGYHWARTSNPFTLKLGNNTSGTWTQHLATISAAWSQSDVLDTVVVTGGTSPRNCRPTRGRDEICNASYGNTGWLGVAQIWLTGGTHIVQGTVKNNDFYFGSSSYAYNNEAEKLHVICQEVGHTFGLDHQSTDGSSLNTCMDYYHNTSNSDTKSTLPNAHDYEELGIIYAHLDSITTLNSNSASLPSHIANGDFSEPNSWGKLVSSNARASTFERDFGDGNKVVTHVIWAR